MGERLAVAAITIDFGNTLVRMDRAGLRAVVERTGERLVAQGLAPDLGAFVDAWSEERDRQFREDIPEFREPDIERRALRALARLRGVAPASADERWDDRAAAGVVAQAEIDAVSEAYGAEFVGRTEPVADATATLAGLAAAGFSLAILSNWPHAATIDRFAAVHGWLPYLRAIVVSQRVGWIKPHGKIFQAAAEQLGFGPDGGRGAILHVGDDWAADVVGAARVGWRTAYLRDRQHDSPLPTSEPGDGMLAGEWVEADLVIDELSELPDLVELDGIAAAALAPRPALASHG